MFSNKRRNDVFEKCNGKCYYCGDHLDYDNFHMDHVIPKAKGGRGVIENLVAACCLCNLTKGDLTIPEFREKIENLNGDTRVELFCKYRDVVYNPIVFYFEGGN